MLKFDNVTLKYKVEQDKTAEQTVLSSLSYCFDDKKITAITGVSGIGKTTILNLAAGLILPNSGAVINTYKKTAYAFQETRLLPWKTALENVSCVCSNDNKARACLEQLSLGESDFNKYPDELSGGMRQRVALARAMAYDADLILLDEPFSGLDEKTKDTVINALKNHFVGRTAIIITHDRGELGFCDVLVSADSSPINELKRI